MVSCSEKGGQNLRQVKRKPEKTNSSGLVRAEDGDTSKFLDGGDTGDDGLVLGELLSSDSEGDGENGRHGDGDTTDQEDEDVVETATVRVVEAGVEDDDFEDDEDSDGDQAEETDLSENGLRGERERSQILRTKGDERSGQDALEDDR